MNAPSSRSGEAFGRSARPCGLRFLATAGLAISLALAGCSGASPSGTLGPPPTSSATEPTPAATPAPQATGIESPIVGSWHRTLICADVRAVFAGYGLLASHAEWACKEGDPPHPHSHFFTSTGSFGSRDPGGQQVDDGDFVLVAPDTLRFPSHEREFGYSPIVVTFTVETRLTFSVQVPTPCSGACADAYAWALSAFGTNPWEPGEIPE